jgi:type IV secretory pathway VirB10-like protein
MNAPAKRFSLQRLLTTPPAPAPEPVVIKMPDPVAPTPPPVTLIAPVEPVPPPVTVAPRAPRTAPEETSHPKKKRSYSVDMKLCEDLEILSWYLARSSSSVVEELIRKHLSHNKSVLQKAREVRDAR